VKLLIVEDEPRLVELLEKGLSNEGFGVECVATGAEAIVRGRSPDLGLVILDLGLADMDGLDVLRRLRREGRRLPVIILTARAHIDDVVSGLDGGADDYVTKPFNFDELVGRIRARLRPRGAAARP
jgi:DNA-binding response OmpR family regulator